MERLAQTTDGGGALMLLAPHREFSEPDLEAYATAGDLAKLLVSAGHQLDVVTERWFVGWDGCDDLNLIERERPLSSHLIDASVLVVARPHGPTAWAQFVAARAFDVPVVATPAAARGLDDPKQWGVHVSELDGFGALLRRLLDRPAHNRRIIPDSASLDVQRAVAGAVRHLGIEASDGSTEPGTMQWLTGMDRPGRHDHRLRQYGRSSRAAEEDPDPSPTTNLTYRPLISVLTPVWNTPVVLLEEAVGSVLAQTYEHWELCLVDDGSSDPEIGELLSELAGLDSRIRVERRAKNGGIAAASNTALGMASGEFVALLDHDDTLRRDALSEVVRLLNAFPQVDMIYSDEDKIMPDGSCDVAYAKPGWSPDLHLSYNFVCHFAVYRRSVLDEIGGWRFGFDGAQDYDLALRVSEATDRIGHIPRGLYHWRIIADSTSSGIGAKSGAWEAGQRALTEALERRSLCGDVEEGLSPGTYHVAYTPIGAPKVGVIVPTRDRLEMLSACVHDLRELTDWDDLEIMVVDNESVETETLQWMLAHDGPIIDYPHQFSYARMMNLAAEQIDADLLLFLNNDVRVTDPSWIQAMVSHAQQSRVGAVGARLMFPGGGIQHEGIVVGMGGVASNVNTNGYFSLGRIVRNYWSLTAACLMVRPEVFWEVGGFEERLRVAFNDVDLTMRIRQLGYDLVYTPHAELVHQESASRGSLHPEEDEAFFSDRWGPWQEYDDPYYNPRLSRRVPFFFAEDIQQMWVPRT